jgi:hypothetical protein
MPWTKDDVDEFREGLTEAQKARWVEIANSVRADCIEEGGSESECDAKAVRVANAEFEGKGASVLDLERLDEQYIVVPTEGQPAYGEVEDLRELEGDFGDGRYPLWSDELQSIVAWAFEKSLYDRDEAEEWVAEVTKPPEGFNFMELVTTITRAMGESITASLASLGIRRPVAAKTEGDWYVSPPRDFPLADKGTDWSWTTEAENAVLGDDDWERFASAHLLVDMSQADEGEEWPTNKGAYKLPVAKEVGGELKYVWNGAAAANGALSGARSELEASGAAKESAADTLRAIYGKFDEDPDNVSATSFDETRRKVEDALWEAYEAPVNEISPWIIDIGPERAIVEVGGEYYAVPYTITDDGVELGEGEEVDRAWVDGQGTPVQLMAFTTKLQSGEEAEPDEDDGLIWKEIIHPGQWHKMDSGRVVEVTADIIESAYEAFRAGLPKFVSVPAGSYHPDSVAAEDNRGFVKKLKMIGDRLFGGFQFTNPDTKAAVEDGSIADCSVYLEPEVTHPESGEKFDWALTHVLLTNNPLVQDLQPFGAPIPASASGNVKVDLYVQDQEEGHMPEHEDITLSAEDQSLLDSMKDLGMSAEDVKALVAEREAVKQKRRDLEVNQIVKALEGADEHDLVEQVDGTRHWPVVIAAAERALREQPEALAMDVEDGRTALDEVVLDVLNAIPADARMQVEEQPAGPKHVDDPTLEDGEDSTEVKDAKAAELGSQLTPRKGSAVGIG